MTKKHALFLFIALLLSFASGGLVNKVSHIWPCLVMVAAVIVAIYPHDWER